MCTQLHTRCAHKSTCSPAVAKRHTRHISTPASLHLLNTAPPVPNLSFLFTPILTSALVPALPHPSEHLLQCPYSAEAKQGEPNKTATQHHEGCCGQLETAAT